MATSFVVPTDDEMVAKSRAIVIGTVEGSFVQEVDDVIETVYELRVERGIKGAVRADELIRIVSPGGMIGTRGLMVSAAAHFRQGDRVLLFLTLHKGRWTATDMTLGKFRFATSTAGDRLLVRDMEDVVGWDHAGQVHREKVRKEQGFLRFVEERARGRQAETNYVVDASAVTIAPEPESRISANAAPFPAATYTDWVNNQPIRWPNISAGVPFWKRSDTNISGASDGGVSVIQGGLAAWTNECASVINLTYAGQRATASANHDGINMVEFNDPQQRISGSWTGSGTVGICFTSFSGTHSFAGATWLNITGADVVFQDGYPATNASFRSAMTHELGHGIGWRHSNQDYATGGACNSSTQECTSAAIMNSSVSANYGHALQPWDVHAAESVYPGGSCGSPTCTPVSITSSPSSTTTSGPGQPTSLVVSATGTTPFSYQWYIGTSGNTSNPISGATANRLTVAPGSTTSYWVRVSNACGVANSATATVTVATASCTPPTITGQPASTTINAPGDRTTLVVSATGTTPFSFQWYRGTSGNTASPISGATANRLTVAPGTTTSYWVRVSNACGTRNSATATVTVGSTAPPPQRHTQGDFNGDGRTDISVYRSSNGVWYLYGGTYVSLGTSLDRPVPADYDGDGRTDMALYRSTNAVWTIRNSSTGVVNQIQFGISGDIPVPADYNRDGRADVSVFRPSNGTWYSNGGFATRTWGQVGDIPVPGDWDADGDADIAVFRPANATWYPTVGHPTLGPFGAVQLGQPGDIPVAADYNGDGRTDMAVFRPSNGFWYSDGALPTIMWGQNGDIPVPGDWDADGNADVAVYRPSNGVWYPSTGHPTLGPFGPVQWGGLAGDYPAIRSQP